MVQAKTCLLNRKVPDLYLRMNRGQFKEWTVLTMICLDRCTTWFESHLFADDAGLLFTCIHHLHESHGISRINM